MFSGRERLIGVLCRRDCQCLRDTLETALAALRNRRWNVNFFHQYKSYNFAQNKFFFQPSVWKLCIIAIEYGTTLHSFYIGIKNKEDALVHKECDDMENDVYDDIDHQKKTLYPDVFFYFPLKILE